jgi:hypothetical protein
MPIRSFVNTKNFNPDIEWDYKLYSPVNFGDILDLPGLYSWNISLSKSTYEKESEKKKKIIESLSSFHLKNKIDLEGTTNFSQFSGHIEETTELSDTYKVNINTASNFQELDFHRLLISQIVFNQPIYIGMSMDLKKRIYDHFNVLESVFYGKTILPDEDGKSFAERLNLLLDNNLKDLFSPTNFFVKVLYFKDINETELQKIEYLLNRFNKPKLGRI